MAEIYLDLEEKDALAKSGLDSANSLYGLANAGALTAESCRGLTPQEIVELETNLAADRLGIKAEKKPLLQELLAECKDISTSSSASTTVNSIVNSTGNGASVPAVGVYLPDTQAPLRSVSKTDSMAKIEHKDKPTIADIETSAASLEKNFSVWLLKAQDQWDEIQMVADSKEFENDFRGLANYLIMNKPQNVLNLSRRNNMLILTDLLQAARNNTSGTIIIQGRNYEISNDPQKRLDWIYDQIKEMNNEVVNEANNGTFGVSDLVTGGISTVFALGVPTVLTLWGLYGKMKFKGKKLPGADKSHNAFMTVWNDVFHGGTADISKLPKEAQQILDEFIMKQINTGRTVPYTVSEFKDANHEANKELKRRQNLVEQHFKGGMGDTFVADLDGKTGAEQRRRLRELGAAVQGKERGNILRPVNTIASVKAPGVTVPLVGGAYPTSANPNVVKGKELLTMMKKGIPVEEVVVNGETLKVKPDELTLARKVQSLADKTEKKVTEENGFIEKRELELRDIKTTEQATVEKLDGEIKALQNEVSRESIGTEEQRVADAKLDKTRVEGLLSNQRREVVSASGEIVSASGEMKAQSGIISSLEKDPLIKALERKRIAFVQAQAESPVDNAKVTKAQAEYETAQRAAEDDVSQLESARQKYNEAEARKAQAEERKTQAEAELGRLEGDVRSAQSSVEKAESNLDQTRIEAGRRALRADADIRGEINTKQRKLDIAREKVNHIDQALRDPRKMDALPDTHFRDFKARFDTKITNLRIEIDHLVSGVDGINKYLAELHVKYPTKIPASVTKGMTKIGEIEVPKLGEIYEAIIKSIGKRAAH